MSSYIGSHFCFVSDVDKIQIMKICHLLLSMRNLTECIQTNLIKNKQLSPSYFFTFTAKF